jgi:Lon protease-like protein
MTKRTKGVDIPLFPLRTVLFPEGHLTLKVFEARYLDMAAQCLREQAPFGVCLIKAGREVGEVATPEIVGTLADIVEADMDTPGIMLLAVKGGLRFVVEDWEAGPDLLISARVRVKDDESPQPIPANCRAARDFLVTLASRLPEAGITEIPDDAGWVGFRLAELLPLKAAARQALLEMNDGVARLEILQAFLNRNQLI